MTNSSNTKSGVGRIAWGRVAGLLLLVGISCAGGYLLQPLISGNKDAINTVVTVFSILAGFLIAVITFVGDPGTSGWRELQGGKREVKAKLRRHRWLFYMYLITLGLALAMFIMPDGFVQTIIWLERFFVGFALFVFLASFSLPNSLSQLQMDKYEAALEGRSPQFLKDLKDPSKGQ